MIGPQLQTTTQIAVGRVLNSLPEGLLIALFAWVMLRFLPRQNSGTRFAVWFVALLGVAVLPVLNSVAAELFGAAGIARLGVGIPLISIPRSWGLLLFIAWILAASVATVRLVAGLWRLRELRRSCIEIDPAIREIIASFNASRAVKIATSERVSVPAVLGFFKPMIVIPSWALRELPPEELRIVLLHEFAHLRRWDDWSNLLQKLVRALFIFHPAVWWIESRLSLEREMACDDVVLAETANPRGYAECMIALLEKSFGRRSVAMAQALVHRAREASLRLARILDADRPNTKRVWKPALGLVGAFSVICLMIAPCTPEFVAFEKNTQPAHIESARLAPLDHSQLPAAAVIPAALHTSQSLSPGRMSRPSPLQHPHAAPRVVAVHANAQTLKAEAKPSPVRVVTAGAKDKIAPEPDALLVIRTTQRVGPDSWVWSVSVWRVILVNPTQDGSRRVPVAHKT